MDMKMTPEQVLAAWEASGGSKLEAGAKRRRKRRCREDVAPALEAGAKRRRRRCRRAREDEAPTLEAGAKKRAKKKVKTFPALVKRCAKKAKTAKGKARCAKKVRPLAAWLGRKKYGKAAMAKKAAAGLRKAARAGKLGKKRRAREDAEAQPIVAGAKKRCG